MDDQFIDDVLCKALDSAYGGSLYWISQTFILNGKKADYGVEYKYEVVSKGGTLVVVEDETGRSFYLTRKKFEIGVALWLWFDFGRNVNTRRLRHCAHLSVECINTSDADEILQYALFEEVGYS